MCILLPNVLFVVLRADPLVRQAYEELAIEAEFLKQNPGMYHWLSVAYDMLADRFDSGVELIPRYKDAASSKVGLSGHTSISLVYCNC